MKTQIINLEEKENINLIKDIIQSGDLVAFPTETVYGLGADGLNPEAVKKIFEVKGRPQDNPLILHVSDFEMAQKLVGEDLESLMEIGEIFWPGPLTLVVKKSEIVPDIITAGLDTVAIRMPRNEIALKIIKFSNTPIAAPSANISGRPSPTDADTCFNDLNGKIKYIVDGGETEIGLESTVLDLSSDIPTILRPGGVTFEQLQKLIPNVQVDKSILKEGETPKSPGQKYKHYAPNADSYLVSGSEDQKIEKIKNFLDYNKDKKISLMVTSEIYDKFEDLDLEVIDLGSKKNLEQIGSVIFRSMRHLDSLGSDIILIEEINAEGLGLAIMNRLKKSTSNRYI